MKNLIAKIPKIEVLSQTIKINYLDLLSKTNKEKEVPTLTYGEIIDDSDDKLRQDLSIKCRNIFGNHIVEEPLTDKDIIDLRVKGFTFLGVESNILIVDNRRNDAKKSFIEDELHSYDTDNLFLYYKGYYPSTEFSSWEERMLKVLIHQMVESKIELQEIVFNDNYFKHDNFTCILRWS